MIGKIIIAAVIVAVAIGAAIVVFSVQQGGGLTNTAEIPDVKFASFDSDKKDIKVGETANVVYNVQNFEERTIDDASVTLMIEPAGSEPYLSISNQTVNLPQLLYKDAATGEINVSITATGSPAKEAVYVVKGLLIVEGVQSDSRQFDLKIRQ